MGLLRVLVGDIGAAAELLSKVLGLGWSSADHPGHVLFPVFAVLLAAGTQRKVSAMLLADLESTCRDPFEALSGDRVDARPTLVTPSIVALIEGVRPSITIDAAGRDAMLDAMRVAAEKRVEAILAHRRRRHYGHAAMLAACCFALAPRTKQKAFSEWIAKLRHAHSRRHAFSDELARALDGFGVPVAG